MILTFLKIKKCEYTSATATVCSLVTIKGIPLFVSTFHNTHFTLSYFKINYFINNLLLIIFLTIKGIPLFVSTFHNTRFILSYFKNL